ncbi:MAG: DUF937 domain-containing protein [Bacteroidota bacterium]
MSLLNELTKTLSGPALDALSGQLGADKQTTNAAIGAALPMIISALGKNASDQGGAEALSNAISKDHDGSILDNLGGFLGSTDNGPGAGILKHVLGGKRGQAETGISQLSGLDPALAGKLMENLAPIVMGMLGRKQRSGGLNVGDIAGMLINERSSVQQNTAGSGLGGLLGGLLDQDGDGNFLDDVGGLLGGMLGGKR